jgi:hypothetical protein
MAVLQARLFRDRLIAAGGIRHDDLEEHQLARRRNPATNIHEIARDPATAEPARRGTSRATWARRNRLGWSIT